MEPLISIIVPVYNLEKYIEKTILNILGQSYRNIEIIAVDDGSTDGSAELLDALAATDPRIRVFHKENGGVSSARLFGIEQAKGEYIGFVDGDDLIDGDMYERLLKNALEYDADISHCGYRQIKPDTTKYFYNSGKKLICNTTEGIVELLKGTLVEPGLWNKLFKKELFSTLIAGVSIFDSSIKNNEDLLMNYILFKNAEKSVFEDFCPYQYIIRENSAAHGKLNEHKLLDPVKAARIIWDDTKADMALYSVAAYLYTAKMLQVIQTETDDKALIHCQKVTIEELRGFIPTFLKTQQNRKMKYQVPFAAYCSKTYRFIHYVYKKYTN